MVTRTERTNSLAIAALVCGIAQLIGLLPLAIAAIVCGHLARRKIRRTGERGRGLATAGLILGYIGVGLLAVTLAVPGINW
jgi:hypothetical protein